MGKLIKWIIIIALILFGTAMCAVAVGGALTGVGTVATAIPQAGDIDPTLDAPTFDYEVTSTPAVSTCDLAREAFLTGTEQDQERALKALQKDRSADGISREYAKYWLGRDKDSPDMRELDESLITTCSW